MGKGLCLLGVLLICLFVEAGSHYVAQAGPGTHCVDQASLKLTEIDLPAEYWGTRHATIHPPTFTCFNTSNLAPKYFYFSPASASVSLLNGKHLPITQEESVLGSHQFLLIRNILCHHESFLLLRLFRSMYYSMIVLLLSANIHL